MKKEKCADERKEKKNKAVQDLELGKKIRNASLQKFSTLLLWVGWVTI